MERRQGTPEVWYVRVSHKEILHKSHPWQCIPRLAADFALPMAGSVVERQVGSVVRVDVWRGLEVVRPRSLVEVAQKIPLVRKGRISKVLSYTVLPLFRPPTIWNQQAQYAQLLPKSHSTSFMLLYRHTAVALSTSSRYSISPPPQFRTPRNFTTTCKITLNNSTALQLLCNLL